MREVEEVVEMGSNDVRAGWADVLNASAVQRRITFVTSRGRRVAAVVPLAVAEAHEPGREAAGEADWYAGDLVVDDDGSLWVRASSEDAIKGKAWGYPGLTARFVPEGQVPEGLPVRPLTLLARNGRPARKR